MIAKRLRHLPFALGVTVLAGVVGTVITWLAGGGTAALGMALGFLLMAAGYSLAHAFVAWIEAVDRAKLMVAGLTSYAIKFAVVLLALGVATKADWDGTIPMALGVAAGVTAWTGAQIWWTWHAKTPYVDFDE